MFKNIETLIFVFIKVLLEKSKKIKRKKIKRRKRKKEKLIESNNSFPALVKKTPSEIAEEERLAGEDPYVITDTNFDTHRQLVTTAGSNQRYKDHEIIEMQEFRENQDMQVLQDSENLIIK